MADTPSERELVAYNGSNSRKTRFEESGLLPFFNYMQLALFVRRLSSMACMVTPDNFPMGTQLIYLSMMIQGDDGYGRWLWT